MKNKKSKKQKEQFALLINGEQYEIGDYLTDPYTGEEGTLISIDPGDERFEINFRYDGDECGGWVLTNKESPFYDQEAIDDMDVEVEIVKLED